MAQLTPLSYANDKNLDDRMKTKHQLREEYVQRRAELPVFNREQQSRSVREKVMTLIERERFTGVHCYVSFGDELSTHELISELWRREIKVICPKVGTDQALSHHEVRSWKDLNRGAFGVLEPLAHCRISEEDVPLVLVPGLAFTIEGDRLGYGKGYYDRFLSGQSSMIVGLAYDEQIVSELPTESHDCRCHKVLTGSL